MKLHQPARAVSVLTDEANQLNGIKISQNGEEMERRRCVLITLKDQWLTSGSAMYSTGYYFRGLVTSRLCYPLPQVHGSNTHFCPWRSLTAHS